MAQAAAKGAVEFQLLEIDCSHKTLALEMSDVAHRVAVAPGAWKTAGVISIGHSGEWKRQSFIVEDALFSGRCNGSDIRLSVSKEGAGGECCGKMKDEFLLLSRLASVNLTHL